MQEPSGGISVGLWHLAGPITAVPLVRTDDEALQEIFEQDRTEPSLHVLRVPFIPLLSIFRSQQPTFGLVIGKRLRGKQKSESLLGIRDISTSTDIISGMPDTNGLAFKATTPISMIETAVSGMN